MIKHMTIVLLVSTVASTAFSKQLTYKADFAAMTQMDSTSLDICGYPETFSLDASTAIGPAFISELFTWGEISTTRIQATDGALSGAPANYNGDYREKVYLVKQVLEGGYEPGIYNRVEMTTYGSTAAPTGFVVSIELLNHRYSAELAEGAFCGNIYYKLQ